MTVGAPHIGRLSPTEYNAIRRCPLQLAFRKLESGRVQRPQAAAARLGSVCHKVLEDLARTGALRSTPSDSLIDMLWASHLAAEMSRDTTPPQPEEWPDYQLIRARLRVVTRRVAARIEGAGPEAELLPEFHLVSSDGLLHGYADLIIRGPVRHTCLDYKTGHVLEPATGELQDGYVAQLRLYAALEHDVSGRWPDAALAVSFASSDVDVQVDPEACTATASDARARLHEFNRLPLDEQPAQPSPEVCRYCPYSVRCAAFWEACVEWPEVRAIRGTITGIQRVGKRGAVISVDVDGGTAAGTAARIRCLDPMLLEAHDPLVVGSRVAAAGLSYSQAGSVYEVRPWTSFAAGEEATL